MSATQQEFIDKLMSGTNLLIAWRDGYYYVTHAGEVVRPVYMTASDELLTAFVKGFKAALKNV